MSFEATHVYHRGKTFAANVEGLAFVQEITPLVCQVTVCYGVGLEMQGRVIAFWGFNVERDLITAWRSCEILSRMKDIGGTTLPQVYWAAHRRAAADDHESVAYVKSAIGAERYDAIMHMPVPDEIVQAILDGQSQDEKLSLDSIPEEVRACTVGWWPDFARFGVKSPDEIDAELQRRKEIIAEHEEEIRRFAQFVRLPYPGEMWVFLEDAIADLVLAGINQPKVVVVAVASILSNCTVLYQMIRLHPQITGDEAMHMVAHEIEVSCRKATKWVRKMTSRKVWGPFHRATVSFVEMESLLLDLYIKYGLEEDETDSPEVTAKEVPT